MDTPLSILLIDDNDTFLSHAARYLERDASFRVVASVSDAASGIERAGLLQPEVILLDLSMPGMDGFEALPLLHAAAPDARIVALTMLEADSYRERAFQCGAHGFVPKSRLVDDLLPELWQQRTMLRPRA